MGEAIRESLDMLRRHRVRMPAEIAMMAKLFANLEGVCFMLDPDIDALSLAESVLAEAAQQRFHPSRMRAAAFHFVRHSRDLTMTAPALLIRVLRRAASGQIRVELGHGTLDRFPHFFEEGLNRLSLSLIAAALFIGSALLVLAKVGPHLFGFPLTALIGLAIGVLVSLSVGWSILRSFLSRRREKHDSW